jgi:hypothetical protein
MSRLLDDVYFLAGTIGPRGTGTPNEAAAAEYVEKRLKDLGLAPEKHHFRAIHSQNAFPLATSLLALLAVVLYPLGTTLTRWLAVILSLGAAWLLWQSIRSAPFNPLMGLLPKVPSQNVEARIQPKGDVRRKAVLLAHLDTNRCRFVWQSQTVPNIRPMTWLTLAIPFCMGMIYLVGALFDGPTWLWWLSLPLAAYELGVIVTLIYDDRTPYSPGAHDDAASVAVALEVAACLVTAPLKNTEVWFVFEGAEETDHAGVIDLLRRHGTDLPEASFIGLEGLGSGEIVYLTRQGICTAYRPTPELLGAAESVASIHPELEFRPATMLMEDDVRAIRERGYRGIGIAACDPQTGALPYWHRPDDTPDKVSDDVMQRAVKIVVAVLEELDKD